MGSSPTCTGALLLSQGLLRLLRVSQLLLPLGPILPASQLAQVPPDLLSLLDPQDKSMPGTSDLPCMWKQTSLGPALRDGQAPSGLGCWSSQRAVGCKCASVSGPVAMALRGQNTLCTWSAGEQLGLSMHAVCARLVLPCHIVRPYVAPPRLQAHLQHSRPKVPLVRAPYHS